MRNVRAAESGNAILRKRSGTKAKYIIESSVRSEYKLRINVIKVNQNLDQCCGHLGRRFTTQLLSTIYFQHNSLL